MILRVKGFIVQITTPAHAQENILLPIAL